MKSSRMRIWLPMFLMCWGLLGACASLPDVATMSDKLEPAKTPSVRNANGNVTTARTKALLAKRWPKGSLDMQTQAALEEAATGVPLIDGNKVTLLFDGPQTMSEMLKAINGARNNINLESYIFDQDELGIQFADALIAKRQQGVVVNILYDSVGTLGVPADFFDRMRKAGINLVEFNPVNPAKLKGDDWRVNNRDHRKVLIVDGKIAFTGGINISATYSKSSLFRSRAKAKAKDDVGWRDTHVKVEGPAVHAFQYLFIRQWTGQDRADLGEADYFPQAVIAGDKVVRVLASDPGGQFEIFKAYSLAMQESKKSIHLTSAYFVPDRQTVDALIGAAKRGVDVKIVLPGVSDSGLVFHASHALYDELLANGVKIFHLQLAVLHAKTAVIDGTWSTVGSTNIDTRSFLHNSELNVVV
ncbi:MAG TPA: phospholipase D-like domain-containing protein, partial [Duganella sp.]